MNQKDNNLEGLNDAWKSGALEDFIRRMLVYFDPMEVIVLGAPHDEYESDIPKIMKMILQEDITLDKLSGEIFNLYRSEGDTTILKRKSRRMAEDLWELKNS